MLGSHSSARFDSQEPPHDIGVLFVHGIGLQRRGQTLAEFGGPVYRWLEDRFRGFDRWWRRENSMSLRQRGTTVGSTAPASSQQDMDGPQTVLLKWRDYVEYWANDGFPPDARPDIDKLKDDVDKLKQEDTIKFRSDQIVGRARLADTVITDPSDLGAPAHAKLVLQRQRTNGDVETERWLLAESWWAGSFPPPGFAELAQWGVRIIPWALGSHLGTSFREALTQRPKKTGASKGFQPLLRCGLLWALWIARAGTAFLGLMVGLLLTPVLLAALGVLLLGSLVPISSIRHALLKFQLLIASTLGDSFMLLSHPFAAASIVSQIRRDVEWLAKRCKVVALVAHSQGAALAQMAFQNGHPNNLHLLFTFGSGLKKLKHIEYVQSHRKSYIISSYLAPVALLLVIFYSAALIRFAYVYLMQTDLAYIYLNGVDVLVTNITIYVISAAVLWYTLGDLSREAELPDLKWWFERLTKTSARWVDCFADSDPVCQGPLFAKPEFPVYTERVCNESSVFRDHTTYWQNRDQFVSLLVGHLLHPKIREAAQLIPAPELAMDDAHLEWTARRRRFRVDILRAIVSLGLISALIAICHHAQAWLHVLWSWRGGMLGGTMDLATGLRSVRPALTDLGFALVPYWCMRQLWRKWNANEMRNIVQYDALLDRTHQYWVTFISIGLACQIFITVRLILHMQFPFWVGYSFFFSLSLTLIWLSLAVGSRDKTAQSKYASFNTGEQEHEKEALSEEKSSAVRFLGRFWNIFLGIAGLVFLLLSILDIISYIIGYPLGKEVTLYTISGAMFLAALLSLFSGGSDTEKARAMSAYPRGE